jgi:hypothetical protein
MVEEVLHDIEDGTLVKIMFKMHPFSPDNIKLIVNIILLKKIFPYQDQVIYILVHISK